MQKLIELLQTHGGVIRSAEGLDAIDIDNARLSERYYQDAEGRQFIWDPDFRLMPVIPEEIELFEKWYPMDHPLPDRFKDTSFIFQEKTMKEYKEEYLLRLLKRYK